MDGRRVAKDDESFTKVALEPREALRTAHMPACPLQSADIQGGSGSNRAAS